MDDQKANYGYPKKQVKFWISNLGSDIHMSKKKNKLWWIIIQIMDIQYLGWFFI